MTHQPVNSTAIESVGYDPETRVLELRYRNGSLYRAEDVPAHEHERLMTTESFGRHINAHLKKAFTFTKVP